MWKKTVVFIKCDVKTTESHIIHLSDCWQENNCYCARDGWGTVSVVEEEMFSD